MVGQSVTYGVSFIMLTQVQSLQLNNKSVDRDINYTFNNTYEPTQVFV
jgi:hypothetical protein